MNKDPRDVRQRERESVCVCVCVCVRAYVREYVCITLVFITQSALMQYLKVFQM